MKLTLYNLKIQRTKEAQDWLSHFHLRPTSSRTLARARLFLASSSTQDLHFIASNRKSHIKAVYNKTFFGGVLSLG